MTTRFLFFRRALADPRSIGSLTPSSRFLAAAVCDYITPGQFVVELGAGTGGLTDALDVRVDPGHLFLIERDPQMAAHLRGRFPDRLLACTDAANLPSVLARHGFPAPDVIVSSLALRALPSDTVNACLAAAAAALPDHGRVLQYTYGRRPPVSKEQLSDSGLECLDHNPPTVWLNAPPARIFVFTPLARPTLSG